jgi:putative ABC transport system permease protein
MIDSFFQDFRYAVRRLTGNPGFTAVAVLTLSLGVGANSAIFSVVNGVLLEPLPYAEPDRLVGLYHLSDGRRASLSGPNFTDLRARSTTLQDAAAVSEDDAILTGQGEPVRLRAAEVTASLFDVLGVHPILGRGFRTDENEPGKTSVAVLGYGLWQERFGGDAGVIGRRITIDGAAREIVGIMPRGFDYPNQQVLWMPIEHTANYLSTQRSAWFLSAVGRVRPGVTMERVADDVRRIGSQLAKEYAEHNEGVGLAAVPLLDSMVGGIRTAMLVLLGSVGFVLLIACANVANLLLARASAREGEIAVRTALGAGRLRIVRQLLTESVILGLLGGGLGLLLAVWGLEFLVRLQPEGIPRLDNVAIDPRVTLFTFALAIVTGLVFGSIPAFQSTRGGLTGVLKESRGSISTRASAKIRGALVVGEMAIAVVLLTGAGLLLRSFINLASVDPGFRSDAALTFELTLPDARYNTEPQQIAFFDQLMRRLKALPGVRAAAATVALPLTRAGIVISFGVDGRPPLPPAQQPAITTRVTTPDYFAAMNIPLKQGRMFTDRDRWGTPQVVLITESAARQYFPAENPLGKRLTLAWGRGPGTPRAGGEIIGIVADVRDAALNEPAVPLVYLPYLQWPVHSMSVVVKTAVPPASITDQARREVHAIDRDLPIANVRTLDQIVARSISQPRFYMTMLVLFAAVALLLAAIGIFGVLSYAVAQRTREIGIRMALGARGSTVLAMVMRHAVVLAIAGIAVGVVASYFLSEILSGLLFVVRPTDPLTFSSVAALLFAVALLASYLPARRATRVDPIVALRE